MPSPFSPVTLQKGVFLIASEKVEEGLCKRAVLLLCEHTRGGSCAVIINKPLSFEDAGLSFPKEDLPHPNLHFRTGGSHDLDQVVLLHSQRLGKETSYPLCPGVFLGNDLTLLEEGAPILFPIFLLFGSVRWTAGVLEREWLDERWFLYPASQELLFSFPPEKLWQTLLRKKGGKHTLLSLLPEHPEWN